MGDSSIDKQHRNNVAVIQPYIPTYREPIFRLLSAQKHPAPSYTLYADTASGFSIKTVEKSKAELPVDKGGLSWRFTKTFWAGSIYYWQSHSIRLGFSRKYNVLICPGYIYDISLWLTVIVARCMRKRVLMWSHGYVRNERGFKGKIRETFYRLASGMLLYGHAARRMMIERGMEPAKLYVVYNSLDYQKQCEIREKITDEVREEKKKALFAQPELPILIFIGRLQKNKKLEMIISAVKKLADGRMPVNALFVGNGDELSGLQEMAEDLNVGKHIVFYGASYEEAETGPLISMADICVSPGEVGLTCIHALTYGTPVITHDDPDCQMPEWEAIRPNVNGALFRKDDIDDLADTIKSWLKNFPDRNTVRSRCQEVIDCCYNPNIQVEIINSAVFGVPSTELKTNQFASETSQ